MLPCEWNLNAWFIIFSLEGLEGVSILKVIFSFISAKSYGTGYVLTSAIFFFAYSLLLDPITFLNYDFNDSTTFSISIFKIEKKNRTYFQKNYT